MLKDIKERLINNPESIINILNTYDFYKPHLQGNEIRCGLYEGSNPTAIHIRLVNNEGLYVNDYSRNLSLDLINYIIKMKNTDFKSVLGTIKSELGVDDFYNINIKRLVFGGIYDRICKYSSELYIRTYPEEILLQYQRAYNLRFAKDNINLKTQERFEIGYDSESQRITIPIRNQYGELIGVKGRANWEITDDESKYLYLIPCAASSTLYGYSQNYPYLMNNDVWIFESEKAVMQCSSYGFNNAVAIGSNSLSLTQCKLLMSLNPKRIVFLLDKSLNLNNTIRNIERLMSYTRMSDVRISYWDWTKNISLNDKASPSDNGKDRLKEIVDNELVDYEKYEELVI